MNLHTGIFLAATSFGLLLTGCGGGSGGGTNGGGGGGSSSIPDDGTLSTVDSANQIKLKNAASGLVLAVAGKSQTAGAAIAQESDSTTAEAAWHVMPMGNSQFNIENMLTHQVIGITNASTSVGAAAVQWADNGTNDHLWQFYLLKDGNYLIKSVNSNLYLEVANSDTSTSAVIDQNSRATTGTGCTCQEWSLTSTNTAAYPQPMSVSGTGKYVHDPMMLQDPATHTYWLYGTHQTLAYSADLSTFTYTTSSSGSGACTGAQGGAWLTAGNHCPIIGPDFPSWSGLQTPPAANNDQNIDVWAPSLLYANGAYYQYYAIPYEPSTGAEAIIGLATSATPFGPWTDQGVVISSWTQATSAPPATNPWNFNSSTTWNAIDPAPFVAADGKWWLVFGSWQDGTHIIPLDPATGQRADATTIYSVAARGAGEEGPFIFPYVVNGTQYYYYFAPINVCCQGTNSTYRTIVGRSTSPTGPYLDRGGIDLKQGGGTILVSTHGSIAGPGGGSVFLDTGVDGTGSQPTFVYHYYDGGNNGTPTLGINRIAFDADGWPYLQ